MACVAQRRKSLASRKRSEIEREVADDAERGTRERTQVMQASRRLTSPRSRLGSGAEMDVEMIAVLVGLGAILTAMKGLASTLALTSVESEGLGTAVGPPHRTRCRCRLASLCCHEQVLHTIGRRSERTTGQQIASTRLL